MADEIFTTRTRATRWPSLLSIGLVLVLLSLAHLTTAEQADDGARTPAFDAIEFLDTSTGIGAVRAGEASMIARTADGGTTWRLLSSLGGEVFDLDFVDEQTGWAHFGDPAVFGANLARTNDGGETWQIIDEDVAIQSGSFTSETQGWQVRSQRASDAVLLASSDGGQSWSTTGTPCDPGAGSGYRLSQVFFLDQSTGWILCAGRVQIGHLEKALYGTADGGASWEMLAKGDFDGADALPRGGTAPRVFFLSASRGWLLNNYPGGFEVYTSVDGGVSWIRLSAGQQHGAHAEDLHFVGAERGWALAGAFPVNGYRAEALYETSDGGTVWEEISASVDEASFDVQCDGTTDSIDAALILQASAGLTGLPCAGLADANGDASIDSLDAVLVLQFTARMLLS